METTNIPFRFETHERCVVLCLTPQLNEVDWGDVEQLGAEILQRLNGMREPALLVDLSELNYMGSSQVALVVRVWKVIKARSGRMAVHVRHPLVKEVLKIAGLNTLWDIAESREGALKALGVTARRTIPGGVIGLIIGSVGLVGALAGLIVALYGQVTLTAETILVMRYASAGLAILGGLWSAISSRGQGRILGTLILLCGLVLAVVQALQQFKVL